MPKNKATKKKSKKDEGETGGIANAGFAGVRTLQAGYAF